LENLKVERTRTKLDLTESGRVYGMNIWATISLEEALCSTDLVVNIKEPYVYVTSMESSITHM
jgi:hypothetical protein